MIGHEDEKPLHDRIVERCAQLNVTLAGLQVDPLGRVQS